MFTAIVFIVSCPLLMILSYFDSSLEFEHIKFLALLIAIAASIPYYSRKILKRLPEEEKDDDNREENDKNDNDNK